MGDCVKAFAFALLVLTAGVVLIIGLDGEDSYAAGEAGSTFTAVSGGVEIEYKILTEGTDTNHGTVQVGNGRISNAAVNESAVNVEMPSVVESGGRTYDVIGIGDYAFFRCSSLTSVLIPDSVTYLGDYAFSGCSLLTSVNIPDGVTSIGDSAFSRCSFLASIVMSDSLSSIGDSAFSGCSLLTSVNIPDGVTSIGDSAFSRCLFLASIVIPDTVTSIGDHAFYGCSSLASITIPNGVTTIGAQTFYQCSSLASITIPDSVNSIGDGVFTRCTSLISVIIPNGVTSIGDETFFRCSSLTSIKIPDTVTSIGIHAFLGCSSLTSVTIPDSVVSIGRQAFTEVCNSDNARAGATVGHILTLIPEGSICMGGGADAYYECEICGTFFEMVDSIQTKVEEGTLSKHSIAACGVRGSTCTDPGYKPYYQCSVCGKYFEDSEGTFGIPDLEAWRSEGGDGYISPSGHTMTLVNGNEPTCTEPGYDECYHCDTCGEYFQDSEGMTGIYNLVAWRSEGGAGYISPSGHSLSQIDGKDPTCTEPGYEGYFQCGVCGSTYEDILGINAITNLNAWKSEGGAGYIGPAGHVFGDDGVCTLCGFEEGADPEPDPSGPGQSDPGQSDTDTSEPPSDPDDGSPGGGNTMLYVGIGAVAAVIIAVGAFLFLRGRS